MQGATEKAAKMRALREGVGREMGDDDGGAGVEITARQKFIIYVHELTIRLAANAEGQGSGLPLLAHHTFPSLALVLLSCNGGKLPAAYTHGP